ncbi:hypothetical protein JCM11491_005782 [Sporobolomyces phaffii]
MSLVIPLASRVQTSSGPGVVRFVGPTSFAAGKWVGVELDPPHQGKNDGSVAGTRYFTCAEGTGVFVRDRMVKLLAPETPVEETFKTPPLPAASAAASRRPSSSASATRSIRPAGGPRPSTSSSSSASASAAASVPPSPRPSSATSRSIPTTPTTPRTLSRTSIARPPSSTGATRLPRTPLVKAKDPTVPNFAPPSPLPAAASSARNETPRASRLTRPVTGGAGLRTPGSTTAMARTLSRESATSTSSSRSTTSSISRIGGGRPGANTSIRPAAAPLGAQAGSGAGSRVAGAARGLSEGSLARMQDDEQSLEDAGGNDSAVEDQDEVVQTTTRRDLRSPDSSDSRSRAVTSPFKRPESTASSVASFASSTAFSTSRMTGDGVDQASGDPLSLRNVDTTRAKLAAEAMVSKREYDSLFTRLQILERRRNEDRDKLRDLERLRDEEDEWNKLRDKIKARLEVVAGEGKELKRENKELKVELESLQSKFDDVQEDIEHSLLDKEIAESELEEEKARVKNLEERVGELEVEVGVFREENARLEGPPVEGGLPEGGSGGVSSVAYRQVEKQNLRLKDALLRLRDLTTETELESKKKIEALEKELDLSSDLQADLDNMAVELDESEAKVEELKAQLDAAAEAQDMLEELTDRNLKLQDDNEELKAEVEELEALRELADELEESHIETEKQLQEELDLKDLLIQDLKKRNDSLEDSCVDYERTISQFRDAVVSLQSDIEDLRRQQSTQATESESLSTQSQAMLNLNLKLKTSVLKSQVKAIDLELRKLEARQASEHLAMVKPYLLPAFFESDADAVDALLFFERLAYKANLVSHSIEQSMPINEALDGIVPEEFVAVCETRAKLGHYASLNLRFAAHLKRCPPEVFLKMGRVYRELAPNEKKLDGFVEHLRKEELKVVDCGKDIEGLIAQSEHLAETHLTDSDPTLDLAEREVACIGILDLDFDTIAAAAGFTKQTIATISRDPDVEFETGDANIDDSIFKPLQTIVNQARNAKVLTKKLLRRFDDLVENSSALTLDHSEGFETLAYNSTAIAQAVSKLGADVLAYCSEVRTTRQPLQIATLASIAQEIAAVELGKPSARPLDEINALLVQLVNDVGTTLTTAMDSEHVVHLSYSPPWLARVNEMHSTAATNIDAERKVAQLHEEYRELAREMRTKEQSHQESAVKIELLEKRLESVKKQAEVLAQLESDLAKSRKQERTYEEANEVLQRDLDAMEQELAKLRQTAARAEKEGGTASSAMSGDATAMYEGNLETASLVDKINSLRSAVRFLRSENSYLKSQDLLSELDLLPSYELPPTPPLTPEPVASSFPDDDDDDHKDARSSSLLPFDFATRAQRNPSIPLPAPSFATRSKLLLREASLVSATPRLVDLSQIALSTGGLESRKPRRGWNPSRRDPRSQLLAEKERARALERKLRNLCDAR